MKKLNPSEYNRAEYARAVHFVSPAEGVTLADLQEPAFWAHVSAKFHAYDKIEVVPQGGAYYAELLVVNCSGTHAKVAVLQHKELSVKKAKDAPADEVFGVEFKGPQRKWAIIRKADKAIVKEEFASKDEAFAWLALHRDELTNEALA
jgi:hypothetical protein